MTPPVFGWAGEVRPASSAVPCRCNLVIGLHHAGHVALENMKLGRGRGGAGALDAYCTNITAVQKLAKCGCSCCKIRKLHGNSTRCGYSRSESSVI